MATPSDAPLQVLEAVLRQRRWPYIALPELGEAVRVDFAGTSGRWTCLGLEAGQHQGLVFLSVCPVACPADARARVAELCLRANQGLVFGSLELDYDTGEVRLKTSVPTPDATLPAELCALLLDTNLAAFDRHLPAIMTVIYGGATPAEALAKLTRETPASE
ncbi:MAG: YbjN domain-containing protein [Deltaproteobacteria bacterium]|nr:YbjN domain-containing protein [Deltaproteobacteria bacterium]